MLNWKHASGICLFSNLVTILPPDNIDLTVKNGWYGSHFVHDKETRILNIETFFGVVKMRSLQLTLQLTSHALRVTSRANTPPERNTAETNAGVVCWWNSTDSASNAQISDQVCIEDSVITAAWSVPKCANRSCNRDRGIKRRYTPFYPCDHPDAACKTIDGWHIGRRKRQQPTTWRRLLAAQDQARETGQRKHTSL